MVSKQIPRSLLNSLSIYYVQKPVGSGIQLQPCTFDLDIKDLEVGATVEFSNKSGILFLLWIIVLWYNINDVNDYVLESLNAVTGCLAYSLTYTVERPVVVNNYLCT